MLAFKPSVLFQKQYFPILSINLFFNNTITFLFIYGVEMQVSVTEI